MIRLAWQAPGVLVGTLGRDVDPPAFAAVLDELLSQAALGSVTFLDLAELDYLDPRFRSALTQAIAKRRGRGVSVHVLATSPYVRLAASVAALELALDDVHWTNDRAHFESELAAAVARRQRRTNTWELCRLPS